MQKILEEKFESDNIWLLMRLLRILTAHNFDRGMSVYTLRGGGKRAPAV